MQFWLSCIFKTHLMNLNSIKSCRLNLPPTTDCSPYCISFRIPEDSFSTIRKCIGIARGFMHDLSSVKKGNASLEAVLLSVPDGYHCVDLCLYKVMILKVSMFMPLIFITGCLYDLFLSKTGKSNRTIIK